MQRAIMLLREACKLSIYSVADGERPEIAFEFYDPINPHEVTK